MAGDGTPRAEGSPRAQGGSDSRRRSMPEDGPQPRGTFCTWETLPRAERITGDGVFSERSSGPARPANDGSNSRYALLAGPEQRPEGAQRPHRRERGEADRRHGDVATDERPPRARSEQEPQRHHRPEDRA